MTGPNLTYDIRDRYFNISNFNLRMFDPDETLAISWIAQDFGSVPLIKPFRVSPIN